MLVYVILGIPLWKALAQDLAGQTQRRWRQEGPSTPIACWSPANAR